MKRAIISLTIGCYLTFLSWGLLAHTFSSYTGSHPSMYYVVWDMFCGWSAWSARFHVVAEGESGNFYELSPGPWGGLKPYGYLDRHNFDFSNSTFGKMAQVILKKTDHEPIARVFFVEESWAKQYNIPDHLWEMHSPDPKDKKCYYRVRGIFTADGDALYTQTAWLNKLLNKSIMNNPRLHAEANRNQPFMAFTPSQPYSGGSVIHNNEASPMVSVLGN